METKNNPTQLDCYTPPLLRAWCEDFGDFKMCYYKFNPCDNGLWYELIEDFHSSEVLHVMQGIGKKDINGKDIYTGDIVKWGHTVNGEEYPIKVAVVKMQPDIQFHLIGSETLYLWQLNFIYRDTESFLEVLGNIFENPELLWQR